MIGPFRATAHRGGAGIAANRGIENTTRAFANARDLGYRYMETDVRTSCDGVVYLSHDESLQRMAGIGERLSDMPASRLDSVLIGGSEPLPRLETVLTRLTDCRFNIDLKDDAAVRRVADVLRRTGASSRVTVASFDHRRLTLFRRLMPGVETSASTMESALFVLAPLPRLRRRAGTGDASCLQLPPSKAGLSIVTPRLVQRAHRSGLGVHVWTIDDADAIDRLVTIGVDGIVSDRIDVLRDVLRRRRLW